LPRSRSRCGLILAISINLIKNFKDIYKTAQGQANLAYYEETDGINPSGDNKSLTLRSQSSIFKINIPRVLKNGVSVDVESSKNLHEF
jgi:hypothetical protein